VFYGLRCKENLKKAEKKESGGKAPGAEIVSIYIIYGWRVEGKGTGPNSWRGTWMCVWSAMSET
jgi:hypothetical protein